VPDIGDLQSFRDGEDQGDRAFVMAATALSGQASHSGDDGMPNRGSSDSIL